MAPCRTLFQFPDLRDKTMFRMTLRRIVPASLASASVDAQIQALGALTYNVSGELVAGRDPSKSQIVLIKSDPESERTSRTHARFNFNQQTGKATVADLGSTNGTYINGDRMTGEHPLRNNDVVAVGQARFTVEIVDLDTSLGHTMMGGTTEMTFAGDSLSVLDIPDGDADGGAGKSMIG